MTWTWLSQGSGRSGSIEPFFTLQPKEKRELAKVSDVEGTVEGAHSKGNRWLRLHILSAAYGSGRRD